MDKRTKNGFALLLLGVIVALGGVFEIIYCWFIGLVLGIIGTALVFSNEKQ